MAKGGTWPTCASPRRCRWTRMVGGDLLDLPARAAARARDRRACRAWPATVGYRCAAHEYRLAAGGHAHVLLYNRLMPWDHLPGWLLHREAGGYAARFDGSDYLPTHRDGGLICAPDRDSWEALRARAARPVSDDEDGEDTPPGLPPGTPFYMTPAGAAALREEIRALWEDERPKVVEVVSWAASLGDRSENADYQYGKRRLRQIDGRVRFLRKRLERVQVVDPAAQAKRDQVFFGATVTYARVSDDAEVTIRIVGVDEADGRARRHRLGGAGGARAAGRAGGRPAALPHPGRAPRRSRWWRSCIHRPAIRAGATPPERAAPTGCGAHRDQAEGVVCGVRTGRAGGTQACAPARLRAHGDPVGCFPRSASARAISSGDHRHLPLARRALTPSDCGKAWRDAMSTLDETDPLCPPPPPGIETVIIPRAHDVGGFEVRRALPARERQLVGPFIFFDQMGPGRIPDRAGAGCAAAPAYRPVDRDLPVRGRDPAPRQPRLAAADPPGRRELDDRRARHRAFRAHRRGAARPRRGGMFGIQSWVALPKAAEETRARLRPPRRRRAAGGGRPGRAAAPDRRARAGGCARRSTVSSPLFYADAVLAPGARLPLPDQHEERGAYVVQGSVEVAGAAFEAGRMLVFRAGDALALDRRAAGRAAAAAGRRGDGRAALPVLELRLLLARADRAGQGRLEGRPLRQGAGRRGGVHPAARRARDGAGRDAPGLRSRYRQSSAKTAVWSGPSRRQAAVV